MGSDKRHFTRWPVSIPCTVEWQAETISGWIANLSLTGALIRRASALPVEGSRVVLRFVADRGDRTIEGRLIARVVHRTIYAPWTMGAREGVGDFGLQFLGSAESIYTELEELLDLLPPDPSPPLDQRPYAASR